MNILVISTVRYRFNGIANVIRNLYLDDVFKGDDISFLFPADNDATMIAELGEKGFRTYEFPRYEKGAISYFRYVRNLVNTNNIDIVHIHGNSHALLIELIASLAGRCKIRICHSHNTTCNNVLMHKLLEPIFNILCTDRFACGEDAGRWMYGNKQFQIINNGINTEKFRFNEENRTHIRKQYGITDDEIVIGHVGNLNTQKNQTFLLDIMSKLNNIEKYKLMLVGEGEKRAELERKTLRLGLNHHVIFVGATQEVPAYLSAMDAIVMPSLYEGLPLSLVEEQANGLTCFVSNNITREVNISGNLHFVYDTTDTEFWVKAVSNFHIHNNRNRAMISDLAINAIKVSGYDIESEVTKLHDYYSDRVKIKHGKKVHTETR